MVQRKQASQNKRLVWRITEAAPFGEFVDPDAVRTSTRSASVPESAEERSRGGWAISSFELLHGTDISESCDTVPAELFDELFAPAKPQPVANPKPKSADGH